MILWQTTETQRPMPLVEAAHAGYPFGREDHNSKQGRWRT